MKKTYLITLKIDDPYPKEFTERIVACSIGTAISRAIIKMRKGPLYRKRLNEVTIKAIKL